MKRGASCLVFYGRIRVAGLPSDLMSRRRRVVVDSDLTSINTVDLRRQTMHVLFVTSETTPFSKTGGLADVCGALPKALAKLGVKVSIVTPLYRCVWEYCDKNEIELKSCDATIEARVGKVTKRAAVRSTKLPGSDVDVYFIEHEEYFNRAGLYNEGGVDYGDNCERFSFFSRASLELIQKLNLDVDVVHANDWQTGLTPVVLDSVYKSQSRFLPETGSLFGGSVRPRLERKRDYGKYDHIKTVMTIHNMRYQGRFWRGAMDVTGLDWELFTYDKMEFYGQLNLLKSGLTFCDAITTVSPKYAEEIQTEDFGEKLQGVLQYRAKDLRGILNGIDYDEWNPKTDKFLAKNYDVDSFEEGKSKCKAALQSDMGLRVDPNVPLFGVVSRFDEQKGLDLIVQVADEYMDRGAQFAVLGSGDPKLTSAFKRIEERRRGSFAVRNVFSVALSHQIEAGADVFLMPSRFEPCGLNQMYSQRYGTLPLVRDVGGLHDSVVNASDENIANGTANGFVFYWGVATDMKKAMDWALHCYAERPEDWKKIIRTAMKLDHSWNDSAKKYYELYCELLAKDAPTQ